jgi:replicative DNA helicase
VSASAALITLEKKILRSLCPTDPSEIDLAAENLSNPKIEQLSLTSSGKNLLETVWNLTRENGAPPSLKAIADYFTEKKKTDLKIYANELKSENMLWGADFNINIDNYLKTEAGEEISQILVEASQINKEGRKSEEGKNVIQGPEDALEHLISKATEIKTKLSPYSRPKTKDEAINSLKKQYVDRMNNPILSYGLGTNFTPIDEATKGAQNKELWLVSAFTSQGKTTFLLNWTQYLAYEGGFNVLYYSIEMDQLQVWRILAAIHSIKKYNRYLEYEKIKSGTLSADDTDFYLNEVLEDLKKGEGMIKVVNPQGPTTMNTIQAEAELVNRSSPLDLLVIDYLGIVAASKEQRGMSKGERINDNIIRAKRMTTEFNKGNGLCVASAHQINRSGYKEAQKNAGVYDISALADASEAERSSDVLLCIYQDIPLRQKKEAVVTNLKNRDGRIVEPFNIYMPPEYRIVGELSSLGDEELSELLEA